MQELAKQFIHNMKQEFFSQKNIGGIDEIVLKQALGKANRKNKQKEPLVSNFTIVSFYPRPSGSHVDTPSFKPYSIRRESDQEIFTIGDAVTNGTKMKGTITSFEILEDDIFVNHTWSGVGMNLDSLKKADQIPSQHQIGDMVKFLINQNFGDNPYPFTAEVKAVHFYAGKVKYDLEIPIVDESPTRIYNIDSCFVLPII